MSERGRLLAPVEREFFGAFFRRLEAVGVTGILLRNYEGFPARIGHDLDVFFRRGDVPGAVSIFREELRGSGGELLHVHERDYVLGVWFRVRRDEPQAIHLDFYHGAFTWHSLPYLGEDEIITESRTYQQFKVLRPAHEALSLFLTSLLWGGFFKSRYRDRLRSLLELPGENAEFLRLLKREFGPDSFPPFAFTEGPSPKPQVEQAYSARLRRAFKVLSLKRRPLLTVFRLGRFWLKEFGTVLSPPGLVLSILGPDGSGKSTVIEAVKQRVEYFFGETVQHHWRPALLPDVGVLLGRRAKTTGPVTNPHGGPPHSPGTSLLRLSYYWLDYWLGYPLRVWKPKAKNHLVIFDRYAQDLWCDPRRYRLNLPGGLTKLLCRLVPQPDLTFVLLANAETIHHRKAEVPLETVRELLQSYARAAKPSPRVRAIDCSPPVDQIADQIAGSVLEYLKAKTAKHPRFR